MENKPFNTVEFAAIQNVLLLATGTSHDLEEMLQAFMDTAVEQLKLSNVYVYILDSVNAGAVSKDETHGFHYYLSYADNQTRLPHFDDNLAHTLKLIYPCNEKALDIVEVDGLQ